MNTQAIALDAAAELLARFESLGGVAGQGGAFAAAQRTAGLSPDGLLAEAEMPETTLIHLLQTGLEGVGDARNILVGPWPNSDQWWARDPRFPLAVPSGVRSADRGLTGMTARMRRRWAVLRARLSSTLTTGDRILVFRGADRGSLPALDTALRQYPSARLLFVLTQAAPAAEHPVIAWSDRVLLAAVPLAADRAAWLDVCRQALAGGVPRVPAPTQAPAAAQAPALAPPQVRAPVLTPARVAAVDPAARPRAEAAHATPAEGVRDVRAQPTQLLEDIAARLAAVGLDPGNAPALAQLGTLQMKAEQFADAVATLRQAEALAPESAAIASQLAAALQRQGDVPGAMATARRMVMLDPSNPRRHLQLAVVLTLAGDTTSAEEVIRGALAMNPRLPDSHVALSVLLGRLGRLPEALDAARAAAALQPNHVRAVGQVGRIAVQMGQYDEAEASFTRAAGLEPGAPNWGRLLQDIRQRRMRDQTGRG